MRTVLAKASLYLAGQMAAHTFIIDDSSVPGSIPGDAGFRVSLREDGSELRVRFFAVTFAHVFYRRFVQASMDNTHDVLPAIFHAAMVRIGDVIGQGIRHADTACKLFTSFARSKMLSGMRPRQTLSSPAQ